MNRKKVGGFDVIVAEHSGFCKGVESAVETALHIPFGNVYLLGELIHNPVVTREVRERGIVTVEQVSQVPDGATLILRSHGAGKAVFDECAARNIRIVDCTCPFVRRSQSIVREASQAGRKVVLIGEKHHPEIEALVGWCCGDVTVIADENSDEISALAGTNPVVLAQTTFSEEKFQKIIKNIEKVCGKNS